MLSANGKKIKVHASVQGVIVVGGARVLSPEASERLSRTNRNADVHKRADPGVLRSRMYMTLLLRELNVMSSAELGAADRHLGIAAAPTRIDGFASF